MGGELHAIAILVLAAGSSSRMGQIKQLLPWKNTTLLGHAIRTALNSRALKTFVVVGAQANEIMGQTPEEGFVFIKNMEWESGMGSSIAAGINFLLESKEEVDGVLVMLADQPFVDTSFLNLLMDNFKKRPEKIIASKYAQNLGVPALFGSEFFGQLSNLGTKAGARTLLEDHQREVWSIELNEMAIDIDTIQEYEKLMNETDQT